MLKIIYYTKQNCSLCEDADALLSMLQQDYEFEIEERDIYTKDEWLETYQLLIPFVQVNDIGINCEEMSLESVEAALKKYSS